MGKPKIKSISKADIINMLVMTFLKVRFDGQKDATTLVKNVDEGKKHPIAVLHDATGYYDPLQDALNATIATIPGYTDGTIEIAHKGGSVIPIFFLKFKEVNLVFRLLPDGPYIKSYKALQEKATKKHLPKQYLITDFRYRNATYHLELIERCEKGSIEEQAKENHSELIKHKQRLLLKYSMNILQIFIDFKNEGYIFPDIKPSNFLITHDDKADDEADDEVDDKVVISDVKSILGIRDKDSVRKSEVMSSTLYESGSGLLRASQGGASDSVQGAIISIDEVELKSRYMAGVTLYELATGHQIANQLAEKLKAAFHSRNDAKNHYEKMQKQGTAVEIAQAKQEYDESDAKYLELSAKRPHDDMTFTQKVFKGEVGRTLKTIIQSFTDKDRKHRMTFEDALKLLAALPGASSLLKARKNSAGEPVAAPSSSTGGDELAASSSPRNAEEGKMKKSVVEEKKRSIFRRGRTASSSTVVGPKKDDEIKEALLSELSAELSPRLSPSKKQQHVHVGVDKVVEEESSSPRGKKEKEHSEKEKRGFFRKERAASSSTVKRDETTDALLSELSSEVSSRTSPSKKQQRFNAELETVAEEESSSLRVKKEHSEENKRILFKRARAASSSVVVGHKIKKSEESSTSEALQKHSVFQGAPPPKKSPKVSSLPLSPRKNEDTLSSTEEEANASPSIGAKVTGRESSPTFFRGQNATPQSPKGPLDESKDKQKHSAAPSASIPS